MTLKLCVFCAKQGTGPTTASYLVVGSRWHHGWERRVVFRGYVCEMHFVEACPDCRVVKHDPEGFPKP